MQLDDQNPTEDNQNTNNEENHKTGVQETDATRKDNEQDNSKKRKISDKDKYIEDLESELNIHKAKVAKLLDENAQQTSVLKAKDHEIENLSQKLEDNDGEMLAEVNDLKKKWIKTLESATKLRAEFVIKEKENTSLQKELNKCKEQIDEKNSFINDLENKVNSNVEECNKLNEEVECKKNKINALEGNLQEINNENIKLRSLEDDFKAKDAIIAELRDTIKKKSSEIKELTNSNLVLDAIAKTRMNLAKEAKKSSKGSVKRGTKVAKKKMIIKLKSPYKKKGLKSNRVRGESSPEVELGRYIEERIGERKDSGCYEDLGEIIWSQAGNSSKQARFSKKKSTDNK
eukprot:TRINITY_DN16004_c0_g1_i9.p1 TRINITY_DN16004_c0_g1~~TRINITY_DN16004_c0_g1_i9.p1  ORF type:complete len:345 (+),score=104.89 TRINITY_DN16004_c0_g1_i9:2-1036(+)